MSTGFGFSVGDLFLALKLIKDSIEAVNESKGASADYGTLVKEIGGLQDGLDAVKELQSDPSLTVKQASALERSIRSCQESVSEFVATICKYQPHLLANTSGFHSNFRKIKWSLCKKDDVKRFRAQLGRHTSAINMLLISFQAKHTLDANRAGSSALANPRKDDAGEISEMLRGLSLEQRQFFLVMMQQNKQLMQSIEDLRIMLQTQTVPAQILLQNPVILLDPLGNTAPFHLDFIDSSECFIAVLRARFSNAGVTPAGLTKLESREFHIQDSHRGKQIDLDKTWEAGFRPGQHVDMSMRFHRFVCPPSTCPGCLVRNTEDGDQIYCRECGLCYQNVQAISTRSHDWKQHLPSSRFQSISVAGEEIPYLLRQPGKDPELRVFRPIRESEDEIFDGYRRVQLVSQSLDLLDGKYPALQLIEDFCRFGELLKGIADDISPYLPDLRSLHARAVQHILQQRGSFPAFASFLQIESVRMRLAKESRTIRHEIDKLVQNLYNDPQTKELMEYIKETYPSKHGKDYYTGVLTRMVSLSDFTKSSSPKARSAERMQWLLLDSRTT